MSGVEKELRRLLWIRHGCGVSALYGDGGEMQCCLCGVDFMRMTPKEMNDSWDAISGDPLQVEILRLRGRVDDLLSILADAERAARLGKSRLETFDIEAPDVDSSYLGVLQQILAAGLTWDKVGSLCPVVGDVRWLGDGAR